MGGGFTGSSIPPLTLPSPPKGAREKARKFHGMISYREREIKHLCTDCIITETLPDPAMAPWVRVLNPWCL